MAEETAALEETCREFVRAMARAEGAVVEAGSRLPAPALARAFQEVLGWVQGTDELPPNCLTREVAQEVLVLLSGVVALQGFRGSPEAYIG